MAVSGGAAAAEEPPQILNSQRGIFALRWGRDGGAEGVITDSSFNLVWMDRGTGGSERRTERSTEGKRDRGRTEGRGTEGRGTDQVKLRELLLGF